MCLDSLFGGGNSSGQADAAAASEAARQANINAGMTNIDQAFSQFTPDYYQAQGKAYSDYYLPQIDKQYNDARQQMILNLGNSGIINSSEGARQLANLDLSYNQQKSSAANQAQTYASQARTQVEDARTQLVNELSASADPAAAAQSAASLTSSLATPPAFSPLGNLFTVGANVANGANNSAAPTPQQAAMFGIGGPGTASLSGAGSSMNVG